MCVDTFEKNTNLKNVYAPGGRRRPKKSQNSA